MMTLKVKKVREDATLPTYATSGSAAADLYACIECPVTLEPGEKVVIPTGIAIELPSHDTVALVFARSGLGINHGITLSNCVGVIDADYRGEICVGLVNLSHNAYTIEQGMRIAQLAVMPVLCPTLEETQTLSETVRGQGGFGSTGK